MVMRFESIPGDQLHSVWPFVKSGLQRCQEVAPVRWLPEDVFTHLRIARAQLHLCFVGEHCRGFLITESRKDPFSNEQLFNVWVAYAVPTTGEHHAGMAEFVGDVIGFLDDCARKVGAKTVTIEGRKGWEKYLRGYFTPTMCKYERQVCYG